MVMRIPPLWKVTISELQLLQMALDSSQRRLTCFLLLFCLSLNVVCWFGFFFPAWGRKLEQVIGFYLFGVFKL